MAPRRRPVRLDRRGNRHSGVRHRMSSLAGRTALVTGGGTGLGAAISRRLHAEGVRVVVGVGGAARGWVGVVGGVAAWSVWPAAVGGFVVRARGGGAKGEGFVGEL